MNHIEIELNDLEYIINEASFEFDKLANSKVLITGGGGFLGYYFVKSFLRWNQLNPKKQISIVVYDNFVRGVPKWLTDLKNKNLTVKKFNIINKLPSNLKGINYLIHAASIASPIFYRKYPIETMDANVVGLRNMLDFCMDKKQLKALKGFLFFSSSEIYGDPDKKNIPTSEEYRGFVSSIGPRACYDESKRYGETMCINFAQQFGMNVKIARPFNNYGPGLKIDDGRVISDFARNILANKDIILLSDGSPTRTFCYITDAIVGYIKILVKGKRGEAYNIGTEKPEISILELSQKMIDISSKLMNYKGKLISRKSKDKYYLTDNPYRRCPLIKKAKKHLGYSPNIKIDDGLRRTLIWYSENR